MTFLVSAIVVAIVSIYLVCDGCQTINIESDEKGLAVFTRMADTSDGTLGRSSYISQSNNVTKYLYFSVVDAEAGTGRWIINDEPSSTEHATAFVGEFLIHLRQSQHTTVNMLLSIHSTFLFYCHILAQ